MYGHTRGKATEIDSVVTAWEPPARLRWHHEAESVDGKPGSVVFAKDATAEVTIAPDGTGSIVTYRLLADPGSLLNTFMLRVMAPRPFFFSSRRRHTRCGRDWSSDVCSSDLPGKAAQPKMLWPATVKSSAGSGLTRSPARHREASR